MFTETIVCDDGLVSNGRHRGQRSAGEPFRIERSSDRVLTGTAGGVAQRWSVEPTVVRAALCLTALLGGIGLVVYVAVLALSVPGRSAPGPSDRRRDLAVAFGVAAVVMLARGTVIWPGDPLMIAASVVAFGVALVWRPSIRMSSPNVTTLPVARTVVGIVLAGTGVLFLANRTGGLDEVGSSAAAIAIVIGGLAAFGAPALGRLFRSIDDERVMRIRDEERARVAAHLHDSVLQSLVLIQRTDDPRRMANLARRQERSLRSWLYGPSAAAVEPDTPTTLHQALDALTLEIERDHDIRVEAVIVGDQPLDGTAATAIAAIRESLVNAARHAQVDRVDVFVETDGTELTAFVRDTGRGFDPTAVASDRRGVRDSIVDRVERAGGAVAIETRVGEGTEVEIRLPRRR
jgi:signal transduction histidine kinase/phage shock protein PspC (stress-responsive transcriptional regulator)